MFKNENTKIIGSMLIEMLIALTLSMLLLATLCEIYLASQRSYRLQHQIHEIQDNATTAMSILRHEIHKAGQLGCPRITTDFPLTNMALFTLTPDNKITGEDGSITVRYQSYPSVTLIEDMRDKASIITRPDVRFARGDIVLISDCKQAEIFEVDQTHQYKDYQIIIPRNRLQANYERHAEIGRYERNKYYVDKTNRRNQDGAPVYALFRENVLGRKEELVEGVSTLTIKYAIYQQNKLRLATASEVTDWSGIVGVHMELKMVSAAMVKFWHLTACLRDGSNEK